MSNQERGDAERVIGAALSVPISKINALIDLVISKGVISHDEVTHIFRGLLASVHPGDDAEMLKQFYRAAIERLRT
jgi:hypothetical protein